MLPQVNVNFYKCWSWWPRGSWQSSNRLRSSFTTVPMDTELIERASLSIFYLWCLVSLPGVWRTLYSSNVPTENNSKETNRLIWWTIFYWISPSYPPIWKSQVQVIPPFNMEVWWRTILLEPNALIYNALFIFWRKLISNSWYYQIHNTRYSVHHLIDILEPSVDLYQTSILSFVCLLDHWDWMVIRKHYFVF